MFRLHADLQQLADQFNKKVYEIESTVKMAMAGLAQATHAFILQKAANELDDFRYRHFIGKDQKNIRWQQMADNIWVVEIDQSVMNIERDSPSVFMDWLLKKNPKAKMSKDGNLYAHIPMVQQRNKGGHKIAPHDPILLGEITAALKQNKISLNKIEKTDTGEPKLGVLHKLDMQPPTSQRQFPDIFSKPRTMEMAHLTGLKPHEGIYKLQGLVVSQRLNEKGKVTKEALVFRTISAKHEAEGRWFRSPQKGLGSLPAAYEWAKDEWNRIVNLLHHEFTRQQ